MLAYTATYIHVLNIGYHSHIKKISVEISLGRNKHLSTKLLYQTQITEG